MSTPERNMLRRLTGSVGHLHVVPMETQLHRNKLSTVSAFMKMESNYKTPACAHLSQNQLGLSTLHAAEVPSQGTNDETGIGFICYRKTAAGLDC